jgi:[protein-PII] uridylyltransferase
MSSTAQRKDIYDPDVIHEFATEVKSEMRLNYLYALTVADITGTNRSLWNSWRATLLRTLYFETRKALRRGLESTVDRASSIRATQERALEHLQARGIDATAVRALWQVPGEDFFLRHTARQIADITARMHQHDPATAPLVLLLDLKSQAINEGATEILLFTRDQPNRPEPARSVGARRADSHGAQWAVPEQLCRAGAGRGADRARARSTDADDQCTHPGVARSG